MTATPTLQLGSLLLSYGAAGIFWGAFAASTPAFQTMVGLGSGAFGLALGAMTLAALPVMALLGRVIHRAPALAIPGCHLVYAIGLLLLATAGTLPLLLAAFAILGAASGALDISLNLRTARVEEDTGAQLFNRAHALFPFMMLVASAATGVLRDAGITTTAIFGTMAGLFLLIAALERHAGSHQRGVTSEVGAGGHPGLSSAIVVLALIAALAAFQEMSAQSWAAIFVETVRGAGPALAGLAPAAFTLGLSLGRLAAHGIDHRLTAMATLRLAALLAIPAFLTIAMPVPIWVVLVAYMLAGVGVGPVEPAVFRAVARRRGGAARGRALATVTAVAYVGYLISPPVLGGIAEALSWPALWIATASLAAGVAGLTVLVPRRGDAAE